MPPARPPPRPPRPPRAARRDGNNNPPEPEKVTPVKTICYKKVESPKPRGSIFKTPRRSTFSPKVLSNRKDTPKAEEKLAVYEFTFDPKEESKLPKTKKPNKPIRKKPKPKAKIVIVKDSYNNKVAKQLENLKQLISKKNVPIDPNAAATCVVENFIPPKRINIKNTRNANTIQKIITNIPSTKPPVVNKTNVEIAPPNDAFDHFDDHQINYSPVTTPQHVPSDLNTKPDLSKKQPHEDDIDDYSFFDEVPLASSSFMSVRKSAEASPWRVELKRPQRWPVNMYVKPNMTPAYESSFADVDIDFRYKSAEKVTEGINEKPTVKSNIFEDVGTLKQTSILSFIKEGTDKNSAATPVKNNSVFDERNRSSCDEPFLGFSTSNFETPKKVLLSESNLSKENNSPLDSDSIRQVISTPEKPNSPIKLKKRSVFFGFDDSENMEDQENTSPVKTTVNRVRGGRILRAKSRAALKEVNQQKPMRMTTVVPVFAPTSEAVNKMYEEIKGIMEEQEEVSLNEKEEMDSAVREFEQSGESENRIESSERDSPSPVGLFEDVEVVHHAKAQRKSYGKVRKMTFQKTLAPEMSESDGEQSTESESEDEQDRQPATFTVPKIREKRRKKTKKKKINRMTKKEEEEAEAWAAGFNSMVEQVQEFPLVVE